MRVLVSIYKITNLVNNKIYIGSAFNFKKRYNNHISSLNRNVHKNLHLQLAYNKYGKNNFKFEIIEECDKDNILQREQYWIDTVKPEYNICKIAGNTSGRKLSEETKKKIALTKIGLKHTEQSKIKMRNKIVSEETRQKISKALSVTSEDLKNKRSEMAKGNQRRRDKNKWPCVLGIKCECDNCKEKKRIYHQQRHLRLKQEKVIGCEY